MKSKTKNWEKQELLHFYWLVEGLFCCFENSQKRKWQAILNRITVDSMVEFDMRTRC